MSRLGIAALVVASLCAARTADAFCGFYVAGGDQQMFNDATQVVLMRQGTRTVLSMQNNYKGPPSDFALVIPVPTVLHEGDVKTLPKDVFDAVEKMGAPRLVEYWEVDPCYNPPPPPEIETTSALAEDKMVAPRSPGPDHGVKIEAQFVVGEYQIVILSAKDSTGLDTWLREQKYNIPAGAEPLLRPYVESGMKFFVAKVDPKKVKFYPAGPSESDPLHSGGDRAALSPLRFHYDSDQFSLPIRLGLANSSGKQDLIVNILSPGQRYEVSNYKNVTIPTNLNVDEKMKDKFAAFYTALFDATVEKNPGAVVTEYSWQAIGCDPCPGPMLDQSVLTTLGMDVLGKDKASEDERRYGGGLAMTMVLTRLHARYGKDITNDLEFKSAPPIVGGREFVTGANGKLEEGARPDSNNNFQARYAIRHAWTGPIKCNAPIRGRWGGPWEGQTDQGVMPATNLAFAPRGTVQLPTAVKQDIPELGIKAALAGTLTDMAGGSAAGGSADARPHSEPQLQLPDKKKSGCGCQTTTPGSAAALAAIVLGLLAFPRRRRKRR